MKKFIIAVVIITAFVVGFFAGRLDTIHNAELINCNGNDIRIFFDFPPPVYSYKSVTIKPSL